MDKKEQQPPVIETTPGMQFIIDLLSNVKTNTSDVKNSEALRMMDQILSILEREKWIEQRHIVKAHHAGMLAEYERSMLGKLFRRRPTIEESIEYFERTFKTKVAWK